MLPRDEFIPTLFVALVFGFIALLLGPLSSAIVVAIVFAIIALIIVRKIKYGKSYGIYQVSPFACDIFDERGWLLVSFKGTDWRMMEEPSELVTTKAKIKKYDYDRERFGDENQIVEIDYLKEYKKVLDMFLEGIVPNPTKEVVPNPNIATLDTVIKNIRDDELWLKYKNLSYEQKMDIAKLMRSALAVELSSASPPKVYKIASLSNQVFIYWFAFGQPAEYYTSRSKRFFKKWRSPLFWIRGFPVVEMYGAELKEMRMIENIQLRTLICMPIQDEKYRREKSLNIRRYGLLSSALATYTQTILEVLPYLAHFDLVAVERQKYKEEKEVYKQGITSIYADISSVSALWTSAMSLLSKVAGYVVTAPGIPEDIKRQFKELMPAITEEKGKIEKIAEKVKGYVTEKPKEETKPIVSGIQTERSEEKT